MPRRADDRISRDYLPKEVPQNIGGSARTETPLLAVGNGQKAIVRLVAMNIWRLASSNYQ
ncbi:MAG: hypothetical protein AB9861_01745 [Methanosarcina sp.]